MIIRFVRVVKSVKQGALNCAFPGVIAVLHKEKLHRILRPAFLIKLAEKQKPLEGITMKWETPAYNDMRFGFEVTMYIYNR